MYKMTCISNVFFMLFSFCLGTEVWYTVIPDKTWDNTSPLKEEVKADSISNEVNWGKVLVNVKY